MGLPTQGGKSSTFPVITPECQQEADIVRAYCEKKFPVGARTNVMRSVTGETYTELSKPWHEGFDSATKAARAMQDHFDEYAKGRSGTLYWRITPEIAMSPPRGKFAYYMRLLISDRPHAKVSP